MNALRIKNLVKEKSPNFPWIKISSDGTDGKKTRTVKIVSASKMFLETVDYDKPIRIFYEASTILKIRVYDGYDKKNDRVRPW